MCVIKIENVCSKCKNKGDDHENNDVHNKNHNSVLQKSRLHAKRENDVRECDEEIGMAIAKTTMWLITL